MAGWVCADCGGSILVDTCGELGLKLMCLRCEAEIEVSGTDLTEEDLACDWDWEEEEASVQAGFPLDLKVDQAGRPSVRLALQSLSGSMPWR